MTDRPLRVLIAKPGLDGHDRGAQIVARALRDAGMEVIYTGIRQTPEMIVTAALQEDVDCIGLSALSGALIEYSGEVIQLLREQGAADVEVVVGGIIAPGDEELLRAAGVAAVFGPGSSMADIVAAVRGGRSGARGTDTVVSERPG
ncbi:MAG TPA: cobalamin B12-binding domain-containing protein [Gaiellaceae bacterium]|nr:cobalamin B12-binding domain-containing protein [Gaiellaceae bacterium]